MGSESLMILYEDNSVEVHYANGSRLLLSPCGSEFLFEKATPPSAHPIQPPERVRQRTPFAISLYREQLLRAIDFRNQYSERPYLPSDILPPERKNVIFTDVTEAKWPGLHTANEEMRLLNGNVKVTSLDGHASLILPEFQQEFTVEFLCKVSKGLSFPSSFSKRSSCKSAQANYESSNQSSDLKTRSKLLGTKMKDNDGIENAVQENNSSAVQKEDRISQSSQKSLFEYCRIIQHISVSSCPEEWKYPLSLALRIHQSLGGNEVDSNKGKNEDDCVSLDLANECRITDTVTTLPSALPLSCRAPFLHRWTFTDIFEQKQEEDAYHSYSQPIKVLWSKGIIYRFSLGLRSIEIYPGDGSVFKSEGFFLGKYFTRYCINPHTKQTEETMYSVNGLPPHVPGSLYSVGTIITQSVRVLQYDLENMLSLTHNYNVCCWKLSSETGGREVLPLPVAETFVPNVGRFFAYSDKKIYAVFCDGTVLNMEWDFSSHFGRSQNPQKNNTCWCKLTCPEGAQQLFQIDHPGPYERYITTVMEWCESLNRDRGTCANTKESIQEQSWSVATELEKIRRFNFLVENSNIPGRISTVGRNLSSDIDAGSVSKEVLAEDVSIKNITESLEKTSKVINDIDSLLASSTKHAGVKTISRKIVRL
uniref:Chromosome 5 open reading frame 34 n=1 Tax=Laticauda laticaudata TaxID=8630 RepID=A0A8C5SJ37_LATLA